MLVASNSLVKFSKKRFSDSEISRKVWLKLHYKQFLSAVANLSKSDLFTVKWVAESKEIR